ncbi:MAG: nucleotidyltransferase [Myxococcales bacterium]|nr:nucleotidyltransferase [Myxococcales bacterium]
MDTFNPIHPLGLRQLLSPPPGVHTVSAAFHRFLGRIGLSGTHHQTAGKRADTTWRLAHRRLNVVDAFPTGSVVAGTALKARSDLDVFLVLHYSDHAAGRTPTEFLNVVRSALSSYNARLVRRNGQAVTLYFQSWPSVDVVPAVMVTECGEFRYYKIADMNRDVWIATNPHAHSHHMQRLSRRALDRIQLLKAWNAVHSAYFQSHHLETLALLAPPVTGDTSWDLLMAFDAVRSNLDRSIVDASGLGYVDDYLDGAARLEARKRIQTATDLAREAWYLTYGRNNEHRRAIEILGRIFGSDFPSYG